MHTFHRISRHREYIIIVFIIAHNYSCSLYNNNNTHIFPSFFTRTQQQKRIYIYIYIYIAVRKQLAEDDRIMTKDQPIFMY